MGLGTFTASSLYSYSKTAPLNKREAVMNFLNGTGKQDFYPEAFFMHFAKDQLFGEKAIDAHLDYFKAADLDFLKVQYEEMKLFQMLQKNLF